MGGSEVEGCLLTTTTLNSLNPPSGGWLHRGVGASMHVSLAIRACVHPAPPPMCIISPACCMRLRIVTLVAHAFGSVIGCGAIRSGLSLWALWRDPLWVVAGLWRDPLWVVAGLIGLKLCHVVQNIAKPIEAGFAVIVAMVADCTGRFASRRSTRHLYTCSGTGLPSAFFTSLLLGMLSAQTTQMPPRRPGQMSDWHSSILVWALLIAQALAVRALVGDNVILRAAIDTDSFLAQVLADVDGACRAHAVGDDIDGEEHCQLLSPGYRSYRSYRRLSDHYRTTIGPLSD